MKQLLVISALLLLSSVSVAKSSTEIQSIRVYEQSLKDRLEIHSVIDPAQIGAVIAVGRELVALGEGVYNLVQKGKPTSVGTYAPIHVLPKDPLTNQQIDPFDLETVADPVVKKYTVELRTSKNRLVYAFDFLLTFQPGGSYDGKGKYILNALVIPKMNVAYGKDFTATMKLQGISNKGTKKNPIASATLTLSYSIGAVTNAISDVTLITIDGLGKVSIH